MKTPAFALVVVVALMTCAGCASGLDVHTASAPGLRLDRYASFAFAPVEKGSLAGGFEATSRSPAVRAQVEALTASALEERGYARAEGEGGELVVRVAVGAREGKVYRPLPVPHPMPSRSSGWFVENEELDVVEGAFVIDLFDAATQLLVWHGAARAEIDPARIDDARLRQAVDRVLASIPRCTVVPLRRSRASMWKKTICGRGQAMGPHAP